MGSQYYEFELDSLDADYANTITSSSTDWPLFQIGGKKPLENIAQIKILEVQIPFSFYVFNTSNNSFVYTDINGSSTCYLPIGNYNALEVATNLGNVLTTAAVASTFTAIYNSNLQKMIVTITAGIVLPYTLTFGDLNDKVGNTNPALLLGFNSGPNTSTNLGILITPNVVGVTGPNYLYLNSTRMGTLVDLYLPRGAENLGGGNAGAQMAKIPINVDPGNVIFWSDPNPDRWFNIENLPSLTEIDFYLSLGNTSAQTPLQLNGQPFSLKLGLLMYDYSVGLYSSGPASNDRVRSRISKR